MMFFCLLNIPKSPIMRMITLPICVEIMQIMLSKDLEYDANILINWFNNNLLKINAHKSHVLMVPEKKQPTY